MKQVFTRNGVIRCDEVPAPRAEPGTLLVRTAFSCISPGTEIRQVRDTEKGPVVKSAVEKPDRVKKAVQMVREEGWRVTLQKIRGELGLGQPLGYSLSGIVEEVGAGIDGFLPGDRVACAGAECAYHAEWVAVPPLLAVKIPEQVGLREAATVALGAIAMQGVRRAGATLGETVVVIGLGAIGQLAGATLKAAGCRVVGMDLKPERVALARTMGFDLTVEPGPGAAQHVRNATDGHGADAVVVAAASGDPAVLATAAEFCRRKGRVVIVGSTPMVLDRKDWYPKELDLLMSTSYGPGRYDSAYERHGRDYPLAYVRWTENRNMAAYLSLLSRAVDVTPLIGADIPAANAAAGFEVLKSGSQAEPLVLLSYPGGATRETTTRFKPRSRKTSKSALGTALVGPGGFARDVHLPNLRALRSTYRLQAVVAGHGHTAAETAKRYGAPVAGTDAEAVFADPNVDVVIISTRHDLHAALATSALRAGKAVFLEKPPALSREELVDLERAVTETGCPFVVGYNRRFAFLAQRLQEEVKQVGGPVMVRFRVNAKSLPPGHWVLGREGGGQLLGEGCHFIDFALFLVGTRPETVAAQAVVSASERVPADSNFEAVIRFRDGSLASVMYTTLGSPGMEKESVEVFRGGQSWVLDNFRKLHHYGPNETTVTEHEDKGYRTELELFAAHVRGKAPPPIPPAEIFNGMRLVFDVKDALRESRDDRST